MTFKNMRIFFITVIVFTANLLLGQTDINKQNVVSMINAIRAKGCNCGDEKIPPVAKVSWNDTLQKVAQMQSDYMANCKCMGHAGEDGTSFIDRIDALGYEWRYCGENVAYGQKTVEDLISAWLWSPGHCRNIMSSEFTEIGLAKNDEAWTLILADPKGR